MMIVVLLGSPCAGKSTQAKALHAEFGIAHISTGDMLREEVAIGSPLGRQVHELMAAGQLVPDGTMIDVLFGRIHKADCAQGFILDGFPRTLGQAQSLDAALELEGVGIDHVIELVVDNTKLLARSTGRFSCGKCGALYNDTSKKPSRGEVCDVCGWSIFTRRDDDKAAALYKQLEAYTRMTTPLLPHYRQKGLLQKVDGMADIQTVTAQIANILRTQSLANSS
jgi:adenylate kinase